MGDMYCKYYGEMYKTKKRNDEYLITSRHKKEGFCRYVDVLGNEHSDLFMKSIKANEVEIIFCEEVFIKYQAEYFELFAGKIVRDAVAQNSYKIWTASEQLAHKFGFEQKEQFVFIKNITRGEIQAVKIIRKPVLEFKEIEQTEEILEGKILDSFLSELIRRSNE